MAGFAEIGVLSNSADTSNLVTRPFAVDRLVLVMSRVHELAERKQAGFTDLLGYHFIGREGGTLQHHIETHAQNAAAKLKVRIRLDSFYGICLMASAGGGLELFPK